MKCFKCGMENKEENKFCLNCGNNLEQQSQQQNMQQPVQPQQIVNQPMYTQQTKKSNKGLIIGLSVGGGVLLLLIIIFVIVFNFMKGAKKALDNIEVDSNITINGNDKDKTKNDKKTSTYSIGDPVTLVDGSKWHVLEYDGKDNITLMLDELVVEETGYGKSAAAEDQKYENSLVKDYLENTYQPELEKSLKENGGTVKGLKVRTLSLNDIYKYGGLSNDDFKDYNGENQCNNSISFISVIYVYDDGVIEPHKIYGDETLTDQDKFMAILSLTNNFWTASNMQERDCEKTSGLNYYGAYYVYAHSSKVDNFDKTENVYTATLGIKADTNGVSTSSGTIASRRDTSAGIRPVIETSIKNIKK